MNSSTKSGKKRKLSIQENRNVKRKTIVGVKHKKTTNKSEMQLCPVHLFIDEIKLSSNKRNHKMEAKRIVSKKLGWTMKGMSCHKMLYKNKKQSLSTMVIKSNEKIDVLEKTAEKLIMVNDNLKTANVKLREKMYQVKDRQTLFKDDIQNSLNSMDITPEMRIIFNKITDKVSDLENKIVDMQDHLDCLPLRQLIEGTRKSLWLEFKGVYGTNQDEPNKGSWKSFYEFVKLNNDATNLSFVSILEDEFGSLSNKIHVSDGKYNHKIIAQSILRLHDSHKNEYLKMYEYLFKEPLELQL